MSVGGINGVGGRVTYNVEINISFSCFFNRLANGPSHTVWEEQISRDDRKRSKPPPEMTDISDGMHNFRPCKWGNGLWGGEKGEKGD